MNQVRYLRAAPAGRQNKQPEAEQHCASTFLCSEAITEVLKLSLFLHCFHLNSQTETLYVTKNFTAQVLWTCSVWQRFHSTEIFAVWAVPQPSQIQSIKIELCRTLVGESYQKQAVSSGQHDSLIHENMSFCSWCPASNQDPDADNNRK